MTIAELEKQIEELDQQYNTDFEQSLDSKAVFELGLKCTMDIIKEYIPKKNRVRS